jgi:hypothetical protein
MYIHSQKSIVYEPESGPSVGIKPVSAFILGFAVFKTERNKFLLFISNPDYGDLL